MDPKVSYTWAGQVEGMPKNPLMREPGFAAMQKALTRRKANKPMKPPKQTKLNKATPNG